MKDLKIEKVWRAVLKILYRLTLLLKLLFLKQTFCSLSFLASWLRNRSTRFFIVLDGALSLASLLASSS